MQYNFQQPDAVPPVVSTDPGYDILTMDCLAANGYGQWTSSSSTTNENQTPSCFLLSNKLNAMPTPGSDVWDDAQTGVLAAKPFTYNGGDVYPVSDVMKVAANLKGNVRYVWIDNDSVSGRSSFYVEGFDPGSSGIDISFSRLPNNDSIVQQAKATGVSVALMSGHQLVNAANEANPQDRFDCAIDASYLYIVWEEKMSGVYTIWGAVVKLSNDSVVMSATKITPHTGSGAAGRRPTVAVDIRNSGSIAPFDVVYLDTTIPSNTGNVWWTEFNSVTFPPPTAITKNFSGAGGGSWEAPEHARILCASEYGVTPSAFNQRGIYIIAGTGCAATWTSCFKHLFLEYIYYGIQAPYCEYCDGTLNNSRGTGSPVEHSVPHRYFFDVDDNPIVAFANPYEGKYSNNADTDFTEFHCLYQIARADSGILNPNNPLMIIPGSHVVMGYCVNGMSTLGNFYNDPATNGLGITEYCAAVNQMGIHVHWTIDSGSIHYYRRDKREFDQNIEENTLMTDTCVVGNTESGVGSASDTLLSNLYLTLYTDPNWEPSLDVVSNGWLDFDNDATLNIGSSEDAGGDFVILGTLGESHDFAPPTDNTYFGQLPWLNNPDSCISNNWTISFGPDNAMDCYGELNFFGNGQFTLTGSGDSLTTTRFGNYVSNISEPVRCTIHNTELLLVPQCMEDSINITATDAIFDFVGNYYDEWAGYLGTYCDASFTKCEFIPDPSSTVDDYSVSVSGYGTWNGSTGTGDGNFNASDYDAAENHTVTFTSCYVTTGIDIGGFYDFLGGGPVSPPSVVINKGLFKNIGIIAGVPYDESTGLVNESPWWPISITDATFDTVNGQGIIINEGSSVESGSIPQNYSIDINENDFKTYTSSYGLSGYSVWASGILIANAPDTSLSDALREDVTVTNNAFESVGGEASGSIDAAIHFMNATGDIGYNQITTDIDSASKYARGIWNESSNASTPQHTWTFICSNKVSGIVGGFEAVAALSTDWYIGYVKLDSFTYNYFGQVSGVRDAGHIDFSGYTNNYAQAYAGSLGSKTDLTGVHHPGDPSIDDPAYNIFKNNAGGNAQISLDQTDYSSDGYSLVYLGQAGPFSGAWSVFGDNDIEGMWDVSSTVSGTPLGDVSNNFWGVSSVFSGYSVMYSDTLDLDSQVISRGFTCSSGLGINKKRSIPLSIPLSDTGMSYCDSLFNIGYGYMEDGVEPDGYDTLRLFMEQCPFYVGGKYNSGVVASDGFNYVSAAVEQWQGGGTGRWPDFLAWLKQVLYLNPDTTWYCQDVSDMLTALQTDEAAKEAALEYVIGSGKCPGFASLPYLHVAIQARHTDWLDSIENKYEYLLYPPGSPGLIRYRDSINADTLANPYDSTVPTLQQVNLQVLLGPQYEKVQQSTPAAVGTQALLSAQLIENPVSDDEIDIAYQMNRTALVTMELSDVLGRSVPLSYAKYQLEQAGSHTASISAPNLPVGTYYLRITTDVGDAITLKVVKE